MRHEHAADDPRGIDDDWLGGEPGLEWGDPRRQRRPRPVAGAATPFDASWGQGAPAREDERPPLQSSTRATVVRRRRIVALGVAGLLVVAGVGVAVVATKDGASSRASVLTGTPTPTATVATSPTTSSPTEETAPTTPAQTQPATPTPTVTLPAAGKLKEGDTGEAVVTLQKALALLDLPVGEPDGRFGAATRDAVIAFQTAQGITPDGIVGAVTAQKLNDALAGGSVEPDRTEPETVTLPAAGKLKEGDTGEAVVTLQKALALLDLPVGEPDGRFGAATRDAVIAFQTAQGITPDGIVGAVTAQKLNDALATSGARG